MTIDRQQVRRRKQIGFFRFGPTLDASQAFKLRGYDTRAVTETELASDAQLSVLAAVVLTQRRDKLRQVTKDLEAHAQRLLNHGCRIIIRFLVPQPTAPGEPSIDPLATILDSIERLMLPTASLPAPVLKRAYWQAKELAPPFPRADLYSEYASWDQIANDITDNPAPRAPTANLAIEPTALANGLADDEKLLLRRAFADSLEVHLVQITDGRSGVSVYRAYPERPAGPSMELPWPLPHFVKIGERQKILAEYDNYEMGVDPYVPFHLGPHLDKDRCCLGAVKGLIVGDYVEGSESLEVCVRAGRAGPAIACLFDRTLHGWYRAAKKKNGTSIGAELGFKFPDHIPPQRIERAHALGSTQTIDQLRQRFHSPPPGHVLIGVVHGDLHALNVRVRGNDAIVIDFLAQRVAPILFDMASLEASMLVSSCFGSEPPWSAQGWLASVARLYDRCPLEISPPHPSPKDPFAWFHEAVRQIRHHAQRYECGPNQYAATLALALLIKAEKDPDVAEPEASSRAVAYLLAEKILANI